jgi:nucleotide-binding universal stress UspA family protein
MAPWYEANLALGPDKLHQQEFPYLQEQATLYLEKLQAGLKECHQGCQIAVRVGEPAREILKYARQVKASMLVMATYPHSRVGHALLGSIADRVICQSDTPVMLVNINLNLKRKGVNLS